MKIGLSKSFPNCAYGPSSENVVRGGPAIVSIFKLHPPAPAPVINLNTLMIIGKKCKRVEFKTNNLISNNNFIMSFWHKVKRETLSRNTFTEKI